MLTSGYALDGTPLGRRPLLGDQQARITYRELERIADAVVAEIDAVNALCQFSLQPNSHRYEDHSANRFRSLAQPINAHPGACARF